MMGVIESLQRQAEQQEEQMEENSGESSAKSEENDKPDEETEVSKSSDSSEKVMEEVNEDDVNPPQKKRKGDNGKAVVNSEEHIDDAGVESQTVACN